MEAAHQEMYGWHSSEDTDSQRAAFTHMLVFVMPTSFIQRQLFSICCYTHTHTLTHTHTHTHRHTRSFLKCECVQCGRHIDDFAVNEIEQLLSHCIMGLFHTHTHRAEQKQFFPIIRAVFTASVRREVRRHWTVLKGASPKSSNYHLHAN